MWSCIINAIARIILRVKRVVDSLRTEGYCNNLEIFDWNEEIGVPIADRQIVKQDVAAAGIVLASA